MESGKEVAEKMKQDGEKVLKSLLTKGTLDRGTLAKTNQKISMGVKRKAELQASLVKAEKKTKTALILSSLAMFLFYYTLFLNLSGH